MFFGNDGLGLEILDVFMIARPKTARTFTKDRDFAVISKRISGSALIREDGVDTVLDPSKLLFIPAGAEYSQVTEGEKVIAVHLRVKADELLKIETAVAPSDADEIFKKMYALWTSRGKSYKYKSLSLLIDLLAELGEDIFTLDSYIEKRLDDPTLSVKELAAHSYVSEQYFRREFKKRFGTSPNKYITERRIERAVALMATGYYSVEEVAEMSGFRDPRYFSTVFKRIVGHSPSKHGKFIKGEIRCRR